MREDIVSWRPKHAYLVSHTHWDREWYLSMQEFRVMLVNAVKGVLDALENDGAFEHFVLDGQAICVEDYLAMCPEDAERVRGLAASGKLSLGPWYILPDEFLVSGEATVRNLLLGHEVATAHGNWQRVGYMPDSFGRIAQMPQLLRRAGIDTFIYTRGNGDEIDCVGSEYRWRAPDGSEVLAVNQVKGYCNAGGLGFHEIWHAHTPRIVDLERAVTQVGEVFEEMGKRSRTPIALLNNGCDHFPVQQEFGAILGALREAYPDTEFAHTDFASFVEALAPHRASLDVFEGELLSGRLHHILSGVWSARMYLKQANEAAQNLLSRVAEPLAAYTSFVHGLEYPQGQFTYMWKRLLENHPHDSICGCSTDEVHRDMIPRFDDVQRSGEALTVRTLQALIPTFGPHANDDRETALAVFNPLPFAREEVVERVVILQPFGVSVDEMVLLDDDDEPVPFEVVHEQVVERFWGVDYRMLLTAREQRERFDAYRRHFAERILKTPEERDTHDTFVTIQFLAKLPATGHAMFRLKRGASKTPTATVRAEGNVLENDLLRVSLLGDGTFDLEDKRTGARYEGLNRFESEADVGDEYDYSPIEGTRRALVAEEPVDVIDESGLRATLSVKVAWPLPAAVTADRKRQVVDRATCDFEIRVTLTHGSPRVEIETIVHNRAHDHRLRAAFPTGLDAEHVISDGHFMLNHRPITPTDGAAWVQPPPDTVPQQDFSCIEADGRGLAILNRGLPEFAARIGESGAIGYLTLLRCVGWLSRDDFASRRHSNAGPTLFTPEAQCGGEHRFDYAVVPYSGDLLAAMIPRESDRFRTTPTVVQGVEAGLTRGGGGLVEHEAPEVSVTAIKRHRSRETLVIRLFNRSERVVNERLRFGDEVTAAWRLSLLEEREQDLDSVRGASLPLRLEPHAIETVEVVLGATAPDPE
jgi:alpha-mannosidase